ncbi:MAG TPA: RsmF rRNA methyltransferase first C-terminal domain-containing protein [Anaerolineales bacterium]|nr:RsmF rRNA methyltransferase first C-terminal domain-containing protein [Anaerolineales bacterium]
MDRTALTHLPHEYIENMTALLGGEAPAFFAHYDRTPDAGLRANPLKISTDELFSRLDMALEPVPWCPDGRIVREAEISLGLHPFHAAGLYYVQEPAAQAVVEVLDPQPGERILDLAAAPGGKTTHIAAKLANHGLLVANEIHPKRVWDLVKNLERWGARNVLIANETPERLAAALPGYFDRVLVDAPCSGEGMFRKMPEAVRDWSPQFVVGCAVRQRSILAEAARLVRPGGRLCYSTCTFAPEENETVIFEFLAVHPDFRLVTPPWQPGFSRGLGRDFEPDKAPSPVRIWPHRAPGEGHFIALFERAGTDPARPRSRRRFSPALERLLPLWDAFARQHLAPGFDLPRERLHLVKSYLYALPDGSPDPSARPGERPALNFVRPGLWLGSFKKDRFEPAHSFAMALRPDEARRVLDLEGPPAEAYLRREAMRSDGEDGWTLAALEGRFPLGWGKRVRGLVKNHYPMGLRLHP